jgi:hypothetical protein
MPGSLGTSGESGPRVSARDLTLWLPAPFGQAAAIEAMGTIAAPLLGGFAFAAIALVVQARPDVRWPDQTLALLVVAFLMFVTCVQATFHAKRHHVAPDEWLAWLQLAPTNLRRDELHKAFVAGLSEYRRWVVVARWSYNLAIVLLFSATAVFLVPRAHVVSGWRTAGIVIAGLAALGECVWVALEQIRPSRQRERIRLADGGSGPVKLRTPSIKPPEK